MLIVKTDDHVYEIHDKEIAGTKKMFRYNKESIKKDLIGFCIAAVGYTYGMKAYLDADDHYDSLTVLKADE